MDNHYEGFGYQLWQVLFVLFVVLPVGLILHHIRESRRASAIADFEAGPDFIAICVYEGNPVAAQAIVDQCFSRMDEGHPAASVDDQLYGEERRGTRTFINAPEIDQRVFTQPQYIESVPTKYSEFIPHFYIPVYAVFKGPAAFGKLQRWMFDNGYPSSKYEFKWTNLIRMETEPFRPTAPGSQLEIVAYYRSGGRIYMWDGSTVRDFSEGFTSTVRRFSDDYTDRYLDILTRLGK